MSNLNCQYPFENNEVLLRKPPSWLQYLCNNCEQFSKTKRIGTVLTLQQFFNGWCLDGKVAGKIAVVCFLMAFMRMYL